MMSPGAGIPPYAVNIVIGIVVTGLALCVLKFVFGSSGKSQPGRERSLLGMLIRIAVIVAAVYLTIVVIVAVAAITALSPSNSGPQPTVQTDPRESVGVPAWDASKETRREYVEGLLSQEREADLKGGQAAFEVLIPFYTRTLHKSRASVLSTPIRKLVAEYIKKTGDFNVLTAREFEILDGPVGRLSLSDCLVLTSVISKRKRGEKLPDVEIEIVGGIYDKVADKK
jgi:hypothetical protein